MILSDNESKQLEFKSKVPSFESLIKTCIAFANASGGRIMIGVDDDSHEVVGISDEDRAKIYDDFPSSLYDSTHPSLVAQIYEQTFGSNSVIIVEIPMSPRKPYFLKSKGQNQGTYIRVGSSTRKATPEYIQDLMREAQRISYDEELISTDISILSKELLKDYFGANVTKKRLSAEKIILTKAANKEQYNPTVAGILMFSETPHHFIPESLIRCTRFKGTEGRDIIRTEDVTGTIAQQASEAMHLIPAWSTTDYILQGVKLEGKNIVPQVALREAIINALLHRKYSIPGAIKIAVYDNRVEIFNPGDFPGVVDINTLGDGTTYLRNPILVRLAYKMKLVETRGTGIRLIYDSCRKAGLRKPDYHEDGDFVKIIFYFESDKDTFKSQAHAVLAYIKTQKSLNARQMANYLGVSHNTAIRKLNELIAEGKVKKTGKGPSTLYHLKN